MQTNRCIILDERPRYIIPTANCFRLDKAPVPEPRSGEILVRTLWLGMEPYLLGKVKRASAEAEPVALGAPMVGPAVGRVERAAGGEYRPGDIVYGLWAWQDYAITPAVRTRKVPDDLRRPSYHLGALGYSGFGAYLAINDLGATKAGDTVLIGTATGGLGQIAGQLARLKGARAVGIAGGAQKCAIAVERFGYDACVDHDAKDFNARLKSACGRGVDVYLETIGGHVLDGVVPLFNLHARMIVCGLMSLYSSGSLPDGPDRTMVLLNQAIIKRLEIRGLSVFDHLKRRYNDFKREMVGWIDSGDVKPYEDVVEGLENAPRALQDLFEGKNQGKSVVKVSD
jgi:NADPH-dependent curcumin reductase CurA